MVVSNYFWIPYELLLNLFEAYLFTWFPDHLLIKRKRERVSFRVCVLLTFLGYSAFLLFDYYSIKIAFSSAWIKLIPAAYAVFFYRDQWWTKVLWIITLFIIPSSVIAFCYYGFAALFQESFDSFLLPGWGRLGLTLVGNALLFISLYTIVRLFSGLRDKNYTRPQSVLFLILIVLGAYGTAEMMYLLYPQGNLSNHLFFLVSMISLTICLCALFLYRSLVLYSLKEADYSYIQGQKNAIDARLQEISEMYSMMQLLNHDIRKHMQVTKDLLEKNEIEESRAYLSEISDNLENLFSTGCLPLDSALTVRKKLLDEKKIGFIYELCDLQKLPLPTSDFCAVVMNLLDNAAEACERYYDETFEHFVRLSIRHHGDMFFIECVNPCPSRPLKKKNNRYVSTKDTPGHGLGLVMVEHITDSINGVCSFTQEGPYFKAYVALPYFERNSE